MHLALPRSRRYADRNGSSHAGYAAHIFLQLGMWPEAALPRTISGESLGHLDAAQETLAQLRDLQPAWLMYAQRNKANTPLPKEELLAL